MRKPAMKRKPESDGVDLVIAVGGPPPKRKAPEMDEEREDKPEDRVGMMEKRLKMLEKRLEQIESSMYEDYPDEDDFEEGYEDEDEEDEDHLP